MGYVSGWWLRSWAILSYFLGVADFFVVLGRDKYTMWDRQPLRQFDRDRLLLSLMDYFSFSVTSKVAK